MRYLRGVIAGLLIFGAALMLGLAGLQAGEAIYPLLATVRAKVASLDGAAATVPVPVARDADGQPAEPPRMHPSSEAAPGIGSGGSACRDAMDAVYRLHVSTFDLMGLIGPVSWRCGIPLSDAAIPVYISWQGGSHGEPGHQTATYVVYPTGAVSPIDDNARQIDQVVLADPSVCHHFLTKTRGVVVPICLFKGID